MTARLRERAVIDHFKDLVKALFPDSFVWKFHQGTMSGTGFPDLLVVLEGHSLHIEAKRYRGSLSSMQEKILHNIKQAGGRCGILHGGPRAKSLVLTPWRATPESDITLEVDEDSKEDLIAKVRKFVDECNPRKGVDGRVGKAD